MNTIQRKAFKEGYLSKEAGGLLDSIGLTSSIKKLTQPVKYNTGKSIWEKAFQKNVSPEKWSQYKENPNDSLHPINVVTSFLKKHKNNPDISEGAFSSLPRSAIPVAASFGDRKSGGALSPNDLKDLGFLKSIIAVPERGQSQVSTYRHPSHNIHLHRHGKDYMAHVDRWPSLSMLMKKMKAKGKDPYSLKNLSGAVAGSAPHILLEGVPGYAKAIKGWIGDSPTLRERLDAKRSGTPLRSPDKMKVLSRILGTVAVPGAAYAGYKYLSNKDKEEEEEELRKEEKERAHIANLRRQIKQLKRGRV